ncbi:hypothetical protein [Bordetella holmesii]|uniref:hypothetical protein n=1 Tax=Bordetella holmesii TaxID=35814 RepID=UPI00045B07C9|nr:hypothetical protein [Bordetella holmesii]KCV14226.1 hypothetical protein AZ25_2188 [Bordetella holmesii 04P3421]
MNAPELFKQLGTGLTVDPGADLSTSMIFHGRHLGPQILDGLNGRNRSSMP